MLSGATARRMTVHEPVQSELVLYKSVERFQSQARQDTVGCFALDPGRTSSQARSVPPRTFRLLALRSRLVPTEPCPPVRCSDDSTRQQSCNRVRCGIRLKRFPLKTLSRVMQPVRRSEPFHRLARCGRTGRTRGTATPTAILGRKPGWRRHSHTIQCDSSHIGTETCRETISLSGQRMP